MNFKLERNAALFEELKTKFPGCDNVWKWFLLLNEIPRPSAHMELVSQWILDIAKFVHPSATAKRDAAGNAVIYIPASPGLEGKPAIVLQTHLDMVPTTTRDFDFKKDLLEMFVDGKYLRAKETTLGADDGSGVAIALALAQDSSIKHGPIELLFTVDEEIGLEGAVALKEGELLSSNAKYLINVDSEEFGEICLSCAGAALRHLSIPVQRSPLPAGWRSAKFVISMLLGGHTGVDIHLGRANAIKWLIYMLCENGPAIKGTPFRIHSIKAGNAHNAVPSKAEVEFGVPEDQYDRFVEGMVNVFNALCARWSHIETNPPKLEIVPATFTEALTYSSSRTACRFLESVHHGIFTWSEQVEILVETSQSLSVVKLEPGSTNLFAVVFARSSHPTALNPVHHVLEALTAVYGGTCTKAGTDMSGWPAEPNSTLAKTAVSVFQQTVNAAPNVTSIHAGLECGIIMSKFPANKMEAISVGPTVHHPHTVKEELDCPSVPNLYKFLCSLVSAL